MLTPARPACLHHAQRAQRAQRALPARSDDVDLITANPKTAGVARWIFLALWGVRAWAKGDRAAKEYVTKVGERLATN